MGVQWLPSVGLWWFILQPHLEAYTFPWIDGKKMSASSLPANGDDDVFANTDNMVEYLQSLRDDDESKHLFTGYLSKYFIPLQVQYPNSYPPLLWWWRHPPVCLHTFCHIQDVPIHYNCSQWWCLHGAVSGKSKTHTCFLYGCESARMVHSLLKTT